MEVLLLIGLTIFLLYILKKKGPLNQIPGPRPFPLVGNMFQLDIDKLFIGLTEYANKYGPIYKIHLFTKPIVVVNDTRLIYEVLVNKTAEFSGRPKSFRMQLLSEKFAAVGFSDGVEEKARRKTIHSYIKQYGSGIQKIEEVTLTATDDLIRRFTNQNGCPIHVYDFLFHCVAEIMIIFLLGDTVSEETTTKLKNILDMLDDTMSAGSGILLDLFPFVRFFGNETYKQFMLAYNFKHELVSGWMESKPANGFINYIQNMPEEELKSRFLDTKMAKHNCVWVQLHAGVYTTSGNLSCLMSILCHYPAVQEKLREEVMDIIRPSRYPTTQDKEKMPYLRATILELGRYATLTSLALPHKALQTVTVDKYTIPKDTEVWINLWALHHDDKLWDKPFAFKPERFLGEDGQLLPADHPNRKNVLMFSAGHRVCVGEIFAINRMFLIIARILQNFTILPQSTLENQPSCDPRDMKMGLINIPPPFKVRMIPLSDERK